MRSLSTRYPISSPISSTDLMRSLFSVYESGDENGGRLKESLLVIRSGGSGNEDLFIFAFENFDFIVCECAEILALRTLG
jgi:hypothetical protein